MTKTGLLEADPMLSLLNQDFLCAVGVSNDWYPFPFLQYIRSNFFLSFICKLIFWPTHLPRLHEGTVRWKMRVLCWLCSSYSWQLHRTKFLLHWPRLETKKVLTAYVSYLLFFLQCYSFVPSYKWCLKVLSLIHSPFLSLWSS